MSDEQSVDDLVKHVMSEDMSPLEADLVINGAGWPPCQSPNEEPVSIFDAHWPLGFVVLWVAWRQFERATEQWRRLQFWGRFIWNDLQQDQQLMSLESAEKEVWRALSAGSLLSIGRRYSSSDPDTAVASETHSEISGLEWLNLSWMPKRSNYWNVRVSYQRGAKYLDVLLASKVVLELWEPPTVLFKSASGKPGRKTTGPKPIKGALVQTRMRALDRQVLENMKLAEMQAAFQMSQSHCKKLREGVLASSSQSSNTDK